MKTSRKIMFLAVLFAFALSMPVVLSVEAAQIVVPDVPLTQGPYVDNIIYTVIGNEDQRVLALQAGDIEMDTGYIDPVHYDTLNMDPDIDIHTVLRNGYGQLTINCRDNPLNYSVLRRAFAYAFDKTAVVSEIFDGFAQEHDSVVPYVNSWCVEDELEHHYYTNESIIANAMLDDAGFAIDGGTGYRETPFGDPFEITIEYASSSPEIAGAIAQLAADALASLHVDAHAQATDFFEYIARLDNHGDYDMVFYGTQFYDYDVDWLAYEYWSEYADVAYQNPCNFVNATFDSWRGQLLNGTTFEDVYEASAQMQKIIHHNVPRLVVYESTYMQAYRTDTYTGHVADNNWGIAGHWTMRKIHRIDGQPGGTVPVAIGQEPDSFNIYVTSSTYSWHILNNMYPSLYKLGPGGSAVGDLATSMIAQTHDDNPSVPEGHMRYTIDIISNATWSDSTPLDANDVAYTFTYNYESGAYGNPAGVALSMLVAAYATSATQVVIEFGSESYWHFANFAYTPIIPQHVFTTIGYSGWSSWNPILNAGHDHVTCGPFTLTSWSIGDWYEITKYSSYHWLPEEEIENPAPIFVSSGNVTYYHGETGNYLEWDVSDDDPLGYILYMDGLAIGADVWTSGTLSFNVDGLAIGLYNVTLQLFDISGNVVANTSWVEVLPTQTTTSGTTTTGTTTSETTSSSTTSGGGEFPVIMLQLVGIGSVAILAVVVVIFVRSRT